MRVIFTVIAALAILGLAGESTAQPSNCYSEWQFSSGGRVVVEFAACEYTQGLSGFTRIEHLGSEPATVCWTVFFQNGQTSGRRCYSRMPPGRVRTVTKITLLSVGFSDILAA